MTGHLNTLPEAENWGFFVICRPQTNPKRMFYNNRRVFQLFLSPVHPKKRRENPPEIKPLILTSSLENTSSACL